MTIKKASKAGARRVTANLDALATLFQSHHASLGIPQKVAMDFAYRCDLLSDSIDKRRTAGYFDPSQIGVEQSGPLQYDQNNPFMVGEFTQEEKRNLSEKQMAGQLADNAAKGITDPKLASLIGKVAYATALTALKVSKKADEDELEGDEPEDEADEGEEASEDAKEQKTAMMAELYNRIRREVQAKKGEVPEAFKDNQFKPKDEKAEEPKDEKAEKKAEESKDEKAGEDEEDVKKTASLFGLFS